MGANAVTTVPVYVSGEVLTAADLNITNSGIPVFATTVTRDAAFGGTGEKTLAEGQFAYIEATNTTQYYDGSSWVAVGASGLTFITGASFTGVATVDSPIDTFTSTYANYLVILDIQTLASFAAVYWRFSTAGTPITSATYDWAGISIRSSGTTFPGGSSASTQFYVGDCGNIEYSSFQFTVINPQISARNSKIIWAGPHSDATHLYHTTASGRNSTAASHDGFRILNSGGVNMTGSYKVYGYSNS
jgi:hypothetical protein